jgi:hypothetical protein
MACGCKKGNSKGSPPSNGNAVRRANALSPQVFNPSQQPQQPLNSAGISAERRKVQAVRRDAIRKAFNK